MELNADEMRYLQSLVREPLVGKIRQVDELIELTVYLWGEGDTQLKLYITWRNDLASLYNKIFLDGGPI